MYVMCELICGLQVTSIPCVVCGQELDIFDRYPLVDGTLFLTPQRLVASFLSHLAFSVLW